MSAVEGRTAEKRHIAEDAENGIPTKEQKLENGTQPVSSHHFVASFLNYSNFSFIYIILNKIIFILLDR